MEEQTGVSLVDALLLASIAPTLGFVGIVLTLIFTSRLTRTQISEESVRATKNRESEKQLERDGLLRHERVPVYRDVIAAANVVLVNSMEVVLHREPTATGHDIESDGPRQAWIPAMASAHLLAGPDVVAAVEQIDQVTTDRYHPSVAFMYESRQHVADPADHGRTEERSSWVADGRYHTMFEHIAENKTLLAALTAACRDSLAEISAT